LLDLIAKEMRVAMVLTGARSVKDISREILVRENLW
jgi:L-lactate dehydrogenase (cytochrome)